MKTAAEDSHVTIEPFNPDKHDRTAFSCGVEQVDNYFKKTANKLQKADNVRLFVMTATSNEVIGFYAINAHAIHYEELPKKYARNRPSHGNIPAAYISMIGRDEKYKGQNYGADLLVDALRRLAMAADQLGISIIMLDVLDCGDATNTARRKTLYESYGFQSLESNPLRMFLPIVSVRTLVAEWQSSIDSNWPLSQFPKTQFHTIPLDSCSSLATRPWQDHSTDCYQFGTIRLSVLNRPQFSRGCLV